MKLITVRNQNSWIRREVMKPPRRTTVDQVSAMNAEAFARFRMPARAITW